MPGVLFCRAASKYFRVLCDVGRCEVFPTKVRFVLRSSGAANNTKCLGMDVSCVTMVNLNQRMGFILSCGAGKSSSEQRYVFLGKNSQCANNFSIDGSSRRFVEHSHRDVLSSGNLKTAPSVIAPIQWHQKYPLPACKCPSAQETRD